MYYVYANLYSCKSSRAASHSSFQTGIPRMHLTQSQIRNFAPSHEENLSQNFMVQIHGCATQVTGSAFPLPNYRNGNSYRSKVRIATLISNLRERPPRDFKRKKPSRSPKRLCHFACKDIFMSSTFRQDL